MLEQPDAPQEPQEQPDSNQQQRIQTFNPTWDEFNHFPSYIEKMIQWGAHKAGLAKVIPPPEWKHHAQYDFNVEEMVIEKPIEQSFRQLSHGVFEAHNVAQKKSIKVKELKRKSEEKNLSTPVLESDEDYERKYWKTLMYFSPTYGADVSGTLFDPAVKEW